MPQNTLADFQDFTVRVHRTADGYGLDPMRSLGCAAMGICGELGELQAPEADILLEAGDVLSYATLAAAVLGLEVKEWFAESYLDSPELIVETFTGRGIQPRDAALAGAIRAGLQFCELAKKQVYQDKPMTPADAQLKLGALFYHLAWHLGVHGYTMRQAITANTLKLETRYPRTAAAEELHVG